MSTDSRDHNPVPQHVAIIMDGNGRWARKRGLPRIEGHRRGVQTVRKIVETATQKGLKQLTLYSFSTENWKRPPMEVRFLMGLLKRFLASERELILKQNIRFETIGQISELPQEAIDEIELTKSVSVNNTGMTLCLALNYGSRQEMTRACVELAKQVQLGTLTPEEITSERISDHLDTKQMPDPDLVIRTAGEYRLSNFLLWQISYAELWVTQKFWPQFTPEDFLGALADFQNRERRFGGLNDQDSPAELEETGISD